MTSRFVGQIASERLLFSETLGLGGYDSLRGFDERNFSADHGWIANFEFGPQTRRWGGEHEMHSLRSYTYVDLGNGYLDSPRPGEDAYAFGLSTGVGLRFQVSDRLFARFDYGIGLQELDSTSRSSRAHVGMTWIPGRRL